MIQICEKTTFQYNSILKERILVTDRENVCSVCS